MTSLQLEVPHQPSIPEEGRNLLSDLLLGIDRLVREITADRDEVRARRKREVQPVTQQVQGSAVGRAQPSVPATGPLVLDLGGPQLGREWRIVDLAVTDAGNAGTAVAGVATFYRGKATPPTIPAANWVPLAPTGLVWIFGALPNVVSISDDARTIIPSDRLYCVITGGTPGQNILAMAEVKDFDPVNQIIAETI